MPPPPGYVITPSGQQPIRSANDTVEYRRNYTAAEYVNALYALDRGYTGQGVTVGVMDDGVNTQLPDFAGRINVAQSKDFGYVTTGGVTTKRNVLGDSQSDHGTAVAAIIAANRDGNNTQGLAPDAQIAVLRISDYNNDTGVEVLTHFIEALDYAGSIGIKVVNSSLTSGGSNMLGASFTRFAATGGLVINSAGNSAGANPDDAAAINASNRAAVLFVVALNSDPTRYGLASYSNQAGSMMDRTVAAPGSNIVTTVNGTTGTFSGTSSATPVVAALAATILSKWPQLTGQQAGDIILNTAKDIGAPGVDPVYGHGLVDFQAALSPVNPTLSNGAKQTSIETSVMTVPASMGITSIQTVLSNVTVLDSYGRDFTGSIAGMVIKPEVKEGHWLRRRIQQMGPGGQAQLAAGPFSGTFGFASTRVGPAEGDVRSTVSSGQVGARFGSTNFRAGWNAQDSLQSDVMGLAPFADGVLAYVPQAGNTFGVDRFTALGKIGLTISEGSGQGSSAQAVTLGWSKGSTDIRLSYINEDGTIMGTPTGEGALRLGRGATTTMVEMHQTLAISEKWNVEGYGSIGATRLKIDGTSLVTGNTAIIGSRIGIQMTGPMLGGKVTFGVAQPLVIESGSAKLTYGSGYDLASQSLTYSTTNASLAGQRRLQLTAGFAKSGPRSSFRVGIMQDVSQHSTSALAGWTFHF